MGDHSHHHGHGKDLDWNAMGESIELRAEVYRPLYAQIIDAVRERMPDPSLIIDAGSGPGVISCALAEAFPRAEVVALDNAPALLERAQRRADAAGLRVRTLLGQIPDAFAGLAGADVVWFGHSLHHVGDQKAALAAAARAMAAGGLLVLLEGGLPARWLPRDIGIGRPGLQARLEAAREEWFAAMRSALPDARHEVEDWPALLAAAGLKPAGTRSFLLDLPAPVPPKVRDHLIAMLEREREATAEHLPAEDLATLDRLLDPDDPAGLRRRPDVFLLDAQTVHFAVKE